MSDTSDDVAKAGLGVLVKALENRPSYASAKVMETPWSELINSDDAIAEWHASPKQIPFG